MKAKGLRGLIFTLTLGTALIIGPTSTYFGIKYVGEDAYCNRLVFRIVTKIAKQDRRIFEKVYYGWEFSELPEEEAIRPYPSEQEGFIGVNFKVKILNTDQYETVEEVHKGEDTLACVIESIDEVTGGIYQVVNRAYKPNKEYKVRY